jgi:hypothetical protein
VTVIPNRPPGISAVDRRGLLARALERFALLLPHLVLISLVVASFQFAASREAAGTSWSQQLWWYAHLMVHWGLGALPIGLAFAMLEVRIGKRLASIAEYMVAVGAGTVVGAIVLTVHSLTVDQHATPDTLVLGWFDTFLYVGWVLLFWSTLGAMLHGSHRRFVRSGRLMRAEQLRHAHSEQRLARMRLAAMRAQIEPTYLLSSLASLESLYATDHAAAERLLDALIAFLRNALTLMRRPTATVGEECRLAADLVVATMRANGAGAETPHIHIASDVQNRLLPAAALLPTLQYIVSHCPGGARADDFSIVARSDGLNIEITIAAPAGTLSSLSDNYRGNIAALESGLRSLCGHPARIFASTGDAKRTLSIIVPSECSLDR